MESRFVQVQQGVKAEKPKEVKPKVFPESLETTNTTFEGPVKTLEQLRAALIQSMGVEEGGAMYDKFVQSIMISTFGNLHKDIDRAQRASKRLRSTYKN